MLLKLCLSFESGNGLNHFEFKLMKNEEAHSFFLQKNCLQFCLQERKQTFHKLIKRVKKFNDEFVSQKLNRPREIIFPNEAIEILCP